MPAGLVHLFIYLAEKMLPYDHNHAKIEGYIRVMHIASVWKEKKRGENTLPEKSNGFARILLATLHEYRQLKNPGGGGGILVVIQSTMRED